VRDRSDGQEKFAARTGDNGVLQDVPGSIKRPERIVSSMFEPRLTLDLGLRVRSKAFFLLVLPINHKEHLACVDAVLP
jgi:hypothetical protein